MKLQVFSSLILERVTVSCRIIPKTRDVFGSAGSISVATARASAPDRAHSRFLFPLPVSPRPPYFLFVLSTIPSQDKDQCLPEGGQILSGHNLSEPPGTLRVSHSATTHYRHNIVSISGRGVFSLLEVTGAIVAVGLSSCNR